MRSKRRGLLFGPREGGCWTFLLQQAWLSFAATAGLAWFFQTPLLVGLATAFFSEAIGLTLFLAVVAQLFWAGDELTWIPDQFYQLLGLLFVLMLLCPLGDRVLANGVFPQLAFAIFCLLGCLLILSLLLRAVMSLRKKS